MLHRNLKGDKNPASTSKYTKFGKLIIRKILKTIATRCHILRRIWTKFDSRRLSVRSFVRPSVCLLDRVWHIWGGGGSTGVPYSSRILRIIATGPCSAHCRKRAPPSAGPQSAPFTLHARGSVCRIWMSAYIYTPDELLCGAF